MMCVACCVHLCMIGYIWKTKNTRVREHDQRCSGTTIYYGWYHASRMTYGTINLRFGALQV